MISQALTIIRYFIACFALPISPSQRTSWLITRQLTSCSSEQVDDSSHGHACDTVNISRGSSPSSSRRSGCLKIYRVSVAELAKNTANPHGRKEKGDTEKRGETARQASKQAGSDKAALKGRYTVCG